MTEEAISHDKLFKTVFKTFLGDLLELMHPELAATLDLDHPRYLSEELFVDFRKEGHAVPDLVAEATTRDGEPRIVLVHVEVEGEFGQAIDQRMQRYSMHLTLREGKPVVSIAVFLTGDTGGVKVRETLTTVGPFEIWRFRYLAFGLSQSLAEDFVDPGRPLAAALAALMRSRVWDKVERKMRCLGVISQSNDLDLRQRFLLARVVNTYVQLTVDEERRFVADLNREGNEEVRKMAITWDETLAEREARGEARGRTRAAQDADLRVAERRFGSLPSTFENRIRATQDVDRLNRILDQILEARSIDEIELG